MVNIVSVGRVGSQGKIRSIQGREGIGRVKYPIKYSVNI